jgi:hypothetical protein
MVMCGFAALRQPKKIYGKRRRRITQRRKGPRGRAEKTGRCMVFDKKRKKEFNTEFTEVGAQTAQRTGNRERQTEEQVAEEAMRF